MTPDHATCTSCRKHAIHTYDGLCQSCFVTGLRSSCIVATRIKVTGLKIQWTDEDGTRVTSLPDAYAPEEY